VLADVVIASGDLAGPPTVLWTAPVAAPDGFGPVATTLPFWSSEQDSLKREDEEAARIMMSKSSIVVADLCKFDLRL